MKQDKIKCWYGLSEIVQHEVEVLQKEYNKKVHEFKLSHVGVKEVNIEEEIEVVNELAVILEKIVQKARLAKESEKMITDDAKEWIDDGLLKQWKKDPRYWFIKDFRRTALVLGDDGKWCLSMKYYPQEEDLKIVDTMLGGNAKVSTI